MLNRLVKTLLAFDADRWITVKPNGPGKKGSPALIGEGGEVKAGMGGKFNGKKISQAKSKGTSASAPSPKPAQSQKKQPQQKQATALDPSQSKTGMAAQVVSMTPLKPEETKALEQYVKDFGGDPPYLEINKSLRETGQPPEKFKEVVARMDEAFSRASTSEQITVYRGVPGNVAQDLVAGSSFVGGGFTSTSSEESVAKSFAGNPSTGAVMEVVIPKGSKALSMYDVPKNPDVGDEKEILLNRGGRYTVREVKEGKPKRIIVEYSDGQDTASDARHSRIGRDRIAFDRASRRHIDANGFLHVSLCHISKEQVADYYGSEIPGWQKLGLEPNRIYRGYRPASELAKAAATFNGLPLLNEHVKDSAEEPQKDLRIGNLGTDAAFRAPYLDNSLIIQDAEATEALNPSEQGKAAKRELSASYRYDPVFKPGVFQGQRYDFIMTNIRGNHVALVEEGRAGSDVVVSDENTITKRKRTMGENILAQLKALVDALSGGGATVHPGGEEEAKAFVAGGEADDSDPNAANPEGAEDDEAEDLGVKLFAYLDNMEDQELAAKVKEIIEAARASEAPAAPVGDEDTPAEDEDETGEKEKDKPAMDRRPGKRPAPARKSGKGSPVTINLAMDANAVAAKIRAGFKAQIEAARNVRPLIGDVDPLAFDSAAQIYGRALNLIGKPSKLTDPKALKELCALASDAKRGKSVYPVVSSVLANDSKGDADPAFANLGNIRKA